MTSLAFASFVRDAERTIEDPHSIAARLEQLLALEGWLAPEHQVGSPDSYRLTERDELVPVGRVEARAGHVEALVPPAENIHRVEAVGDSKTISIHVYGADVERLGSSILRRFDDRLAA